MPGPSDPNDLAEPLGTFVRFATVAARKVGRTVSLTSGRRSYEAQVELRRAHCGTSQFDIYEKPASQCSPPTARPGSSNHQTGEAADLSGSKDWAYALLRPFNVRRPVPGEDWHFEYRGDNAQNDLAKLARSMEAAGFTEAEMTEVFGTPPGERSGLTSPFRVVAGGLSWVIDLAGRAPGVGGIVDDIGGAVGAIGRLVNLFETIASWLTDPSWWRRVGQGAAGAAMIWGGAAMLVGDIAGVDDVIGALR